MVMHTVPGHLRGASLGEAHKWIREQMVHSNPSKPRGDYTLSNENGQPVNLSDLTRGNASHVTINAAGEVRNNPAHPADLRQVPGLRGFMEVPAPMHASRLTALTQDQITPALWHSMVNEYGLFGATQTLSILLTRPISPSLRHTPKTMELIRARKGESLIPIHQYMKAPVLSTQSSSSSSSSSSGSGQNRGFRSGGSGGGGSGGRGGGGGGRNNPRTNPMPAETLSASRALGLGGMPGASSTMQRAGILNLDNDRITADIRREVDRVLDTAETEMYDDEHGALVSMANKMSLQYENSSEIFDNFSKNVLAPYLITSTANLNALKYINEYILPKMREVIMDGRGGKDKKLRKLDRQYKHIVNKLATDPKDFYMGTEFALVAHPAFLFPRAGLVLMPIPNSTKDMAFRAFEQAGTPPTYDPGTGFIATAGKSDKTGVAYIGQETFTKFGKASYNSNKNWRAVSRVIDSLINVVERVGETDSTGFNVVVRGAQSMAAMKGKELHQKIQGKPAFYFVDLPGIRPIPTNWPQGLVMAMMETLAKGRDRITGLNGKFDSDDFLTPSGINLGAPEAVFSHNSNGTVQFESFADFETALQAANAMLHGTPAEITAKKAALKPILNGIIRTVKRSGGPDMEISTSGGPVNITADINARRHWTPAGLGMISPRTDVAKFLKNMISIDNDPGVVGPVLLAAPVKHYTISTIDLCSDPAFFEWARGAFQQNTLRSVSTRAISPKDLGDGPSAYQIMVDSVELCMRKYNYEPNKDDIYFTMILLYYSLREMNLDTTVTPFLERAGKIIAAARNKSLRDFRKDMDAKYPPLPVGGPPVALTAAQLNNYLAVKYAYEAFSDPTSDAFRSLTGVRVNPRPNPPPTLVTDKNLKSMRGIMKESMDSYEAALKATGPGTQSEEIVKALETIVMPSLLRQMKTGASESMFAYAGDRATTEDKLIEIADDLYEQCKVAVTDHIESIEDLVNELKEAYPGNKDDLLHMITEVQHSSDALKMLDHTADMMADFVKFMPKGTSSREKDYVKQMKNFMNIIGDSLQFTPDNVADFIKSVKSPGIGNPVFTGIIKALIADLDHLRSVGEAFELTIDDFEKYSRTTIDADTRYPNAEVRLALTPTDMRKALVLAHMEMRTLIFKTVPLIENHHIVTHAATLKDIIDRKGQPNLFADHMTYMKTRHDNISALMLNTNPALTPAQYKDLFLDGRKEGVTLFNLVKKNLIGEVRGQALVDSDFRTRIERTVDLEYNKYKFNTNTGVNVTDAVEVVAEAAALALSATADFGTKKVVAPLVAGVAAGAGVLRSATYTGWQGGRAGMTALGAGAETLAAAFAAEARVISAAITGSADTTVNLMKYSTKQVGAGLTRAGAASLDAAAATFAASVKAAGATIGASIVVGSAFISKGIAIGGLLGSIGISVVASSIAYYQNRRELKRLVMTDEKVVETAAYELASKLRQKTSQRNYATTQREQRALQLEIDMLDLGGQRLRHIMAQAKLEAKTADADAAAAISRQGEAETTRLEAEINLAAGQLEAELTAVTRESERTEDKLDRQEASEEARAASRERLAARADTVEDLKLDLRDHRRKIVKFKNKHFGKALERREQNQLTELNNEEANILKKIRKASGEV
jgi:hypothetical protein